MYAAPPVDTKLFAPPPGAQADAASRAPVQQRCETPASARPVVPVYRRREHTPTPDSWATICAPS
ncbi:MAG TPA: hypothetical protein VGN52_18960 [Burkholderiales bacterium]|jgi:hypothetical protein